MLNLEEYNAVFSWNLDEDTFRAIMGSPCQIQDAEELIFVDPKTHEKFDSLQCVCRDCHATIHDYYGRDRRYKLDELGRVIVL